MGQIYADSSIPFQPHPLPQPNIPLSFTRYDLAHIKPKMKSLECIGMSRGKILPNLFLCFLSIFIPNKRCTKCHYLIKAQETHRKTLL